MVTKVQWFTGMHRVWINIYICNFICIIVPHIYICSSIWYVGWTCLETQEMNSWKDPSNDPSVHWSLRKRDPSGESDRSTIWDHQSLHTVTDYDCIWIPCVSFPAFPRCGPCWTFVDESLNRAWEIPPKQWTLHSSIPSYCVRNLKSCCRT